MSMLTIPSGIKDPSYRYKMPKMMLKQESRLNGVKTNIVNVDDIAEHLRVPSLALMKWFCAELGANMEKTSLIKGNHAYDILLKHLDKFILRYVCCQNCKYPELKMKVEGKDLLSVCNSCGNTNKHDSMHKAGKVFMNDLKQGGQQKTDITNKDEVTKNAMDDDGKKKKKDKKNKKDDEEEEEEEQITKPKEADISDNDDELTWNARRIKKVTEQMQKLSADELANNDQICMLIDDAKDEHGITADFAFYVALVGLFPPSRNILKNWEKNQETFVTLVKQEGKIGRDHFMQAVCLYFIKTYNKELSKFAPTFMKKLVDENILSEKFLIDWFDKNVKLDKESGLYDKKSEKKFRELIEPFVEWMKNAESGSDDSSSEEDKKPQPVKEEEDEEEEKGSEGESEAAKKQREMMAKQKEAQQAAFAKHQKKVAEEEEKQAEAAANIENDREARVDIKDLGNEEFDIDDI